MKSKLRVLIVDDDEGSRETLADIFEAKGYESEKAKDAYEAIEKFRKKGFDFVIMDIKMPGMSGIEACEKIYEIGKPKIILITAYALDKDMLEAVERGVTVLHKPLDIERIFRIMEQN